MIYKKHRFPAAHFPPIPARLSQFYCSKIVQYAEPARRVPATQYPDAMNHHQYFDDQRYIAEQFLFIDNHVNQLAQLAMHKINSLKLSSIHAAFCYNREELYDLVKKSLLNFVPAVSILQDEGFFDSNLQN